MTKTQGRILTYVEDPGAANYLTAVLTSLGQAGTVVCPLASGAGYERLCQDGHPVVSIGTGDTADSLLERFAPTLIVVGTSENTESLGLDLIRVGRQHGIITVGVIDGAANAAWRFAGTTENPLAYAPDWVLVPDEMVRQNYLALGLCDERVVVAGHPHYDQVQAAWSGLSAQGRAAVRARLFPNAGERPVVTFIAEISTGLDPGQYVKDASYTLQGRGRSARRTDVVIEELLDALAKLPCRPYCVLRLHPKNTLDEFAPYIPEFDQVSHLEKAWDVVFSSDLVVGMSSHLLIESAILRRPTLSILPRACEQEWLPTITAGLTPCTLTSEALYEQLRTWAFAPQRQDEVSWGEQVFRFGATERVTILLSTWARVGDRELLTTA